MKEGQQLSIHFDDEGQPMIDNSTSWTSFLGTLESLHTTIPIAIQIRDILTRLLSIMPGKG